MMDVFLSLCVCVLEILRTYLIISAVLLFVSQCHFGNTFVAFFLNFPQSSASLCLCVQGSK